MTEFHALLERHARAGTTGTLIPRVLLSRMEDPGGPDETTSGTVLAVVAQGTKRLLVGDRVHDYGAGQYLVASIDLPVSGRFEDATPSRPALGFGLELRPELVAELMRSEEHTSELQSLMRISYAVFCLKKK